MVLLQEKKSESPSPFSVLPSCGRALQKKGGITTQPYFPKYLAPHWGSLRPSVLHYSKQTSSNKTYLQLVNCCISVQLRDN